MQINFNNNINFTGGFRLPQINQAGRELLDNLPKRGKQIFYDFEKPGDVFLITRDSMDLKIAKFIKEHHINCEYYPEINTNSRLDNELPHTLSEALKGKIVERNMNRVKKYRKIKNGQVIAITPETEAPKPDFVTNILDKLLIFSDKVIMKDKHGAKIIEDHISKKRVYISPPNEKNVHYVLVDGISSDFFRERYAIQSDGTIVKKFTLLEDIKPFNEAYNSLLKKDV